MKLKGTTKIELFDALTGKKKNEVKSQNMMTNAIRNILNPKPEWFWYGDYYKNFMSNSLPIYNNLLGGVMLWSDDIEEDANNIIPPISNNMIGCAGSEYSGTNTYRGSYNTNESSISENSVTHVWDFGTDKANGTFRALSLTSKIGGNTGWFGDAMEKDQLFLSGPNFCEAKNDNLTTLPSISGMSLAYVDNDNIAYYYSAQNKVITIKKYKITNKFGLQSTTGAKLISETSITTNKSIMPYNLSWFLNENNKLISIRPTNNTTIDYVRIDPITCTIEEEKTILLKGMTIITYSSSTYTSYMYAFCEYNGELFLTNSKYSSSTELCISKFDHDGNYIGNIENIYGSRNFKTYIINDTLAWVNASGSSGSVHNRIYLYNGDLKTKVIYCSNYSKNYISLKPVENKAPFFDACNSYKYVAVIMPYMASINNLFQEVTKTNKHTLKVSYTIEES